jgi:hypothetical protein
MVKPPYFVNALSISIQDSNGFLASHCRANTSRHRSSTLKFDVPGGSAADLFESAKSMITKIYGTDDLNDQDASDYQLEIYSVHSVLEQIFEKGQYQQVIHLMHWSLQFEENLAGVSWPGDFIDSACMPLVILCLKSYLRLGKTPAAVRKILESGT